MPAGEPCHTAPARISRSGALRQLLTALCEGRRRRMALGLLLAGITALAGALLLGVSGWFITGTAIAGMSLSGAMAFDVFVPAASIRLLAIGRTISRYGERVVTHSAALQALVGVRERLFLGFARESVDSERRWQLQPARQLLRLTRDLNAAESLYLRLLVPSCAALAASLGISAWLAFQNVWLGLACLLWLLGCGIGITAWLVRATTALTLQQSRHNEQTRKLALDLAGAQGELVMAGQFDAWQQRLLRKESELAWRDAMLQRYDALAAAAWQVLHSLTMAAAIGVAAWLVLVQHTPVTTAAFFVLVALAGMEPFAAMRRGALEWAATVLASRRLAQPLAQTCGSTAQKTAAGPAASATQYATAACPPPGLAAHLRSVSLPGSDSLPRLAECSLDIACAETVAIVGPSGCGKSTLLSLIAGQIQPATGRITALRSVTLRQHAALFNDSVRANLDLQRRQLDDQTLWAALEAVGLREAIAARPHGLDDVLGEGGLGLSKGQGRRLALARLYLAGSSFWLLDEPSDGLDGRTADEVLTRLGRELQSKTVVIATHMRREAALAQRLIVLSGGRIERQAVRGTPAFTQVLEGLREG